MRLLFQKTWFLPLVLVSLVLFAFIYSFLFPSVPASHENWLPVRDYLPKFEAEGSDSFILSQVYPLISEKYRLNSDVGHYLEVARNFNPEYFEGHVLMSRPLYSFLILVASLPARFFVDYSYGVVFAAAIMLNLALLASAILIFFTLLKKLFSLRTAFLSSLLLIFSPFVHTALAQARAEILTVFSVIAAAYLLYAYAKSPSIAKLVLFSLILGILMLGKMFLALPFFIFLLALYLKRYREGIAFLIIQFIPFGLWYLFVTEIWQIPFYVHEAQYYGGGMWFLKIFHTPWQETFRILLESVPNFTASLIYGFLLLPIIFSVVGFFELRLPLKRFIYFSAVFSVFLFSLAIDTYYTRISFLLFPIVYPTCIMGIEKLALLLKRHDPWLYPVSFAFFVGSIIFVSSANVFQFVYYF